VKKIFVKVDEKFILEHNLPMGTLDKDLVEVYWSVGYVPVKLKLQHPPLGTPPGHLNF